MNAIAMHENPALLDPAGTLTPAERTMLRRLDRDGSAVKVRWNVPFYMLGGTKYAARTIERFLELGLAVKTSAQGGNIVVALNYAGRLAAERLRTRRVPGAHPADD